MGSRIQITEVLWVLAAIPGLLVWTSNLRHALAAFKTARQVGTKPIKVISSALLVLALGGTTVALFFILLGSLGMTQESYIGHITLMGWAVTAVIVLTAAITLAVGLVIRRASVIVWSIVRESQSKR
jgi:hypothetical protein